MKLKDVKNWKAVHFEDRTILKSDEKYFSECAWKTLTCLLEVEEIKEKGHYRVIQK